MEIENVRGPLEECAEHYREFKQMYVGPVVEGITAGNEHLRNAAVAIGQALAEIDLAVGDYRKAEAAATYARTSARLAERIANNAAVNQSTDPFFSESLPLQSRTLVDFSQQIPTALVQLQGQLDRRSGSIRLNLQKAQKVVDDCVGAAETQLDLEPILSNGNTAGEWADRIRSYISRL